MLTVENLTKTYKSKKGTHCEALKNVSINFGSSGLVFILGKSGSGKSTLLNMLGGLDSADSGSVIIGSKKSADFEKSEFDAYRNTCMGFIFQEFNVLNNFSVYENINIALQLQRQKNSAKKIKEILKQVGLEGLEKRKISELSGGQKQRVAIARALVKNSRILLCDEPTGNLDSTTAKNIFLMLKDIAKEKLVIIVSHDYEAAQAHATRIVTLKDGEIESDVSRVQNQKSFSIKNGKIIMPSARPLTQSEVEKISQSVKENKGAVEFALNSGSFKQTDSKKINKNCETIKLTKSRMPNWFAAKMGISNFATHKLKFAFTVFFTILALTLFGVIQTVASYNNAKVSAKAVSGSNTPSIALNQSFLDSTYKTLQDEHRLPFKSEVVEQIEEIIGEKVFKVYNICIPLGSHVSSSHRRPNFYIQRSVFPSSSMGIVVADEKDLNGILGLNNLTFVAGEYPKANAQTPEVAITDYIADAIISYSYVKDYEEVINYFNDFYTTNIKITGIINTGYKTDFKDVIEADNSFDSIDNSLIESFINSALIYSYAFTPIANIAHQAAYQTSFTSVRSNRTKLATTNKDANLRTDLVSFEMKISDLENRYNGMFSGEQQGMTINQIVEVCFSGANDYDELLLKIQGNSIYLNVEEYNNIFSKNLSRENGFAGFEEKTLYLSTFSPDKSNNTPISVLEFKVVGVYDFLSTRLKTAAFKAIGSAQAVGNLNLDEFYNCSVIIKNQSASVLEQVFKLSDKEKIYAVSSINLSLYQVDNIFTVFLLIFNFVAAGLAVICILLLFNFISGSVVAKKKEIGILRGLGARGRDVAKIFMLEGMLIGLVTIITSFALLSVGVAAANKILISSFTSFFQSETLNSIKFLNINFGTVAVIFGVCGVIVAVAAAAPVVRISKMKPIDAIKHN